MKHNHPEKEECKHEELTYCKDCDVVECKCGREWELKESDEKREVNKCGLCGDLYRNHHSCVVMDRTSL